MQYHIANSRINQCSHDLIVAQMADELHARGADMASPSSVIEALTAAGFVASRIEQCAEAAVATAKYYYGHMGGVGLIPPDPK